MRYLIDSWKQINGNLFMLICLFPILAGVFISVALIPDGPTLRDKLSQPTPMVSSFEVKAKHHGVYQLSNVNGDELDQADYALEGDYEVGDVVTVLWADDSGEEIAGDVLVGKASELDLVYRGGHE